MTTRSLQAGPTPTVIIRAGGDVTVEAAEGERVLAETPSRAGLKLTRGGEAELARMRAKVGDRVLLDVRVNRPKAWQPAEDAEAIQVQMGGSGRVQVPPGSRVKVYAGRHVAVSGVGGPVSVYSGGDARLRGVGTLAHASTGGALDVDCQTVAGDELKLAAGRDLRLHVRDLTDARLTVTDLGGDWQGRLGAGRVAVRLKAGGDVTLVTDQLVTPEGPDFVIGRVERPE
jgi:hypothetical protein